MKTALLLLTFLLPLSAMAEVLDSAANGFTVKTTVTVKAAPDEVFKRLVHIGDWWSSSHTFSGDAHNLTMEPRAGGCFCERLPNQGGVRHMEVIYIDPGKMVRLSGGLGPFQGMAGTGVMTFTLSAAPEGTRLEMVYAFSGYTKESLPQLASGVDEVLTEQLTRLKSFTETGSPVAAAAPAK